MVKIYILCMYVYIPKKVFIVIFIFFGVDHSVSWLNLRAVRKSTEALEGSRVRELYKNLRQTRQRAHLLLHCLGFSQIIYNILSLVGGLKDDIDFFVSKSLYTRASIKVRIFHKDTICLYRHVTIAWNLNQYAERRFAWALCHLSLSQIFTSRGKLERKA